MTGGPRLGGGQGGRGRRATGGVESTVLCINGRTTCRAAVAETGTIALDGGLGLARALMLVPDYHLVVQTEISMGRASATS